MEYIQISQVRHFFFCKRRFGLQTIAGLWNENYNIISGNIFHEGIHTEKSEFKMGKWIIKNANLYHDTLFINGIADEIDAISSSDGIILPNKKGKWELYPVEYKVGKKQINNSNKAQVCLQAMCLEFMLDCKINEGYIFYGKEKRREVVNLDNRLREEVLLGLDEIRFYIKKNIIPEKTSDSCQGCSFYSECN